MKIEVNIEKKHLVVILSTIFILAGLFVVYAYNSSGTSGVPSAMGHSVDEIDWTKQIQGKINASGDVCGNGKCLSSSGASTTLNCTTTQSAEFCGPSSSAVASCPSGYFVAGGGYGRTKWSGGEAGMSMDRTEPAGNTGWSVLTGGNMYAGDCWVAYARCCKLG